MASIISAGTTSGTSLNLSGDTSGVLQLASNGSTTAVTISTGQVATFVNDAVINGLTVGKGGGAVSSNTAFGFNALTANEAGGTNNTAIGNAALDSNTTGDYNTALGDSALAANTTGVYNTAVGYQAKNVGTGGYNSCFGAGAGSAFSTGAENTLVGYFAGGALTTGNKNLFLGGAQGNGSGGLITTGNSNVVIGSFSGNSGGYDFRTASNHIVLSDGDGTLRMYMNGSGNVFWNGMRANAGTYTIRLTPGAEMVFDVSSAKYKNNIRNSVYGLDAVMQLKSRQFEYKDDGRSDVGLIAEEVYEVIPELAVKNKDGEVDAVSYDRFVSVCIKAIQELNAKVDAQAAEIAALKGAK
jgi:hypothetical protein